MLSEREFMTLTNGLARTRLFNESDYVDFQEALRSAKEAAMQGEPYYQESNAGGVANAYKYKTTTARWGVWVDKHGTPVIVADRADVRGRHVPCAYRGGRRQYLADFKKRRVRD